MTTDKQLPPLPTFDDNLRLVIDSRHGRAMIWELLRRSGFLRNAYLVSGGDKDALLFNLGQQNFGAMLYDAIDRVSPAHWVLMRNEAKQDDDYERNRAEQQQRAERERNGTADDDFPVG